MNVVFTLDDMERAILTLPPSLPSFDAHRRSLTRKRTCSGASALPFHAEKESSPIPPFFLPFFNFRCHFRLSSLPSFGSMQCVP